MYGKTLCVHNDNRVTRQHERQRGSVELTVSWTAIKHDPDSMLEKHCYKLHSSVMLQRWLTTQQGSFQAQQGSESSRNQLVRDRHITATNRSSQYKSNQYKPYFLRMGREVRTPANIVNSFPEAPLNNAFDRYADELLHRLKRAYQSAIQHLKAAADRTKRNFDIRIRHRKYRVSDWVYHCNPRKEVGCQDKRRRKFSGSFLVVAIPGPFNVILQRSQRAKPFCTHIDKVKLYVAEQMPRSWLSEQSNDNRVPAADVVPVRQPEVRTADTAISVSESVTDAIAGVPSTHDYRSPRPKRQAGRPQRYRD